MTFQNSLNARRQNALKGLNSPAQGTGLELDKDTNPEGVAFRRDIGLSVKEFNPYRVGFDGVTETQGAALGLRMQPLWGCF